MADIGYNDNVSVSNRTFHIQTATNIKKGSARCEVFEQGKLITTYQINFERRKSFDEEMLEKRIRHIVSSLHRETIEEIEMLFQISEKVKKLKHAPSSIKLGLIFFRNNLYEDAITHFENALSIDPNSGEALNYLGLTYIHLGQSAKAIKFLKMALDKKYKYADLYQNLGLAYLSEKQHYKAAQYLQEAIRINPHYHLAHFNLAIVYIESCITDRSDDFFPPPSIRLERALQQLRKLNGASLPVMEKVLTKVENALAENKLPQAVQILTSSREKIFPAEIDSLIGMDFYLKFMYGGKNLNNDIIKKFETRLNEAIEKNGNFADLWNNLGIVHLIQCRNLFLQAINEFDKALELNPSFDKALKNKKLVENDGKEFLILLRAILR